MSFGCRSRCAGNWLYSLSPASTIAGGAVTQLSADAASLLSGPWVLNSCAFVFGTEVKGRSDGQSVRKPEVVHEVEFSAGSVADARPARSLGGGAKSKSDVDGRLKLGDSGLQVDLTGRFRQTPETEICRRLHSA
jgi:hypothetical protein